MSERYFPGEKIRITIDAEVSDHSGNELEYTYPTALGAVEAAAVLDGSPVTVERCDPEWWPPRPGDLLREGDRLLWFAYAEGSNVLYRTAWSERMEHQEAWEKRHQLTLVHREDEQDGGTR